MYRFSLVVSRSLLVLAGAALLAMTLLVVANIVLRQVSASFGGTTEVVGWLTAAVVSLSLAHAQSKKAHIELDLVVARLPRRLQTGVQALVLLASLAFFAMVAYQLWHYGLLAMQRDTVSQSLRLAIYPIIYLVAFGFSAFCLVLLTDLMACLTRRVRT
ncbi:MULTISPECIES: TRAP transporter small permease [unclassified Modicisalibacter]|nr:MULTISPECIES: TRAP transporter small permease [unclassified Modicisalibacter]MBZ9558560.1 TRAP transporter small permease [Modicisalibacter sp. R2A 31.J]MBZ9575548.1 TRAP transporter small permease [Modicisalibacter sp. MOD 31.J]